MLKTEGFASHLSDIVTPMSLIKLSASNFFVGLSVKLYDVYTNIQLIIFIISMQNTGLFYIGQVTTQTEL